ncbi:MAG TPA: hypothetical protein VIY48_07880, partial [Candidatus Paceibacterota bacterium]
IEQISERLSRALQAASGAAGSGKNQAITPPELPSPLRLIQAVQQLNSRHYQARWEARPDVPRTQAFNIKT